MKKILFALMIVVSGAISAQSLEKAPGDSIPWELRKQSFIYNTAKIFNDPVVARTALYSLLSENPNNVALYDSLAILYFQYNQHASAALVAQQALQINPDDQFAMEIAATSLDKLGAKDRSLNFYEKLYLATGQINTLYKVAFLQFELDRYAESNTSLDIIIGDPQAEEFSIRFPTQDGAGQNVSLKVASHRVKAMILEDKGDIEGAKKKYLEVLEMQPGFQIVQQQLREMTKPKTEGE
ncbi:tetratricopeptide repeat protein [Ekhidna sp.]|uniref:tetratricopeptide repeat protein n=1 Tax=Ekhidna sp. TaxID=2608089 RepID=UPI003CCBA947